MAETKIQWCTDVWNPVRGCRRVSSGCENCYAERIAARFSGEGMPYEGLAENTPSGPRWTGKIRLVEEKLSEPLGWRKPRRVFVNSMSDLFHEDVPDEFIAQVWDVMRSSQQHIFQILTKRPERMAYVVPRLRFDGRGKGRTWVAESEGSPDYPLAPHRGSTSLRNVWLGVSVEDQKTADDRIPLLLKTPAAVRFVSAEPLLGPLRLGEFLCCDRCGYTPRDVGEQWDHYLCSGSGPSLHWVIIGGESGPGARPMDLRWARDIAVDCGFARVPAFIKQLGSNPFGSILNPEWEWPPGVGLEWSGDGVGTYRPKLKDPKGGNPDEWPEDLRVREFPQTDMETK